MPSAEERQLLQTSLNQLKADITQVSDDFYTRLLAIDPSLEEIFAIGKLARQAKLVNMQSAPARAKDLDKISQVMRGLGERHADYGAHGFQFHPVRQAMLDTLAKYLGAAFDKATRQLWNDQFQRVEQLMLDGLHDRARAVPKGDQDEDQFQDERLLQDIGGEAVLTRVHSRFYDWIFEDAWLGRFFAGKSKSALIKKQTDFMVSCFGGENRFHGDTPAVAHMHMLVTDEMYDLRQHHLHRCIREEGLSENIAQRWLSVDAAFRKAIVRENESQCVMRCMGQFPLVVKKPAGYPWPYTD